VSRLLLPLITGPEATWALTLHGPPSLPLSLSPTPSARRDSALLDDRLKVIPAGSSLVDPTPRPYMSGTSRGISASTHTVSTVFYASSMRPSAVARKTSLKAFMYILFPPSCTDRMGQRIKADTAWTIALRRCTSNLLPGEAPSLQCDPTARSIPPGVWISGGRPVDAGLDVLRARSPYV